MGQKIDLNQLQQSGATDGQVMVWSATSGKWLPGVGAKSPEVILFTSSGTWTKPSGAKLVVVEVIGGGGGGGSGRRGASGSARSGGAGGNGAGRSTFDFNAVDLSATVTVTVGAGGTGGPAQTTDNTDGALGNSGGASRFGSLLEASGGYFGPGGYANNTGPVQGGKYGEQMTTASVANTSVTGNYISATQVYNYSAVDGGPGGSITTGNTAYAGGISFAGSYIFGGEAIVLGGTIGVAGSTPPLPSFFRAGGGGGGGGAHTSAAGGAGGAGGAIGGGGGGGGASTNGFASGAGGAGASGAVRVITYF